MDDHRIPFVATFAQEVLDGLRARLNATRWEEPAPPAGWTRGTDATYLRALAAYWAGEFNWSAQADRLNRLPNYRMAIDGAQLHYIDAPAQDESESSVPLLLLHGWPSSIFQMIDIIPRLTAAATAEEASCHVICPSLPGYGFSEPIARGGDDHVAIAIRLLELMKRLGHDRFAIRASDVGAVIGMTIAAMAPDRVIGLHMTGWIPVVAAVPDQMTEAERSFVAEVGRWNATEGAYAHLHSTRPDSLVPALMDSPVGLAAWIIEKFRAWCDCDGDVERAISRDELLANLTLYWATGTIGSSIRFYLALAAMMAKTTAPPPFITTPTAMYATPVDLVHPPREWVARSVNIVRWTEASSGGHFTEWEVPQPLAADIRQFLAMLVRCG